MLLTIIIPSFQVGNYIADALESIRKQGFISYEILIMDGGSTDSTAAIVNNAVDLPIRFIQESDAGVYDAMNKGIQLAKGQWIYFMGADDKLYNNVLNNLQELFLKKELDVFYGDVIMTKEGNTYDGYFDLNKLLFIGNICHQAIFYRKEVFDKIGDYNLKYKIWADWDFNIRCFKHNKLRIEYVNEIIAYYNNQSGVSAIRDEVFLKELPVYYMEKIVYMEQTIKGLLNSKFLRLGIKVTSALNKLGLKK